MDQPTALRIEIFSDTICPWCFIGKRRFERALAHRRAPEVEIVWLPFQLNPDMEAGGMERQRYLEQKFGGAVGAKRVYDPIEVAGSEEGIDFRFDAIDRTPSTLDSHRLIHYARNEPSVQDAVVEALFASYFLRGEDIGDPDVLVFCAVEAGLDGDAVRAYLGSEADTHTVRELDVQARQLGIQGVPFFVIDRRYAVSGAQAPENFVKAFDVLGEEARAGLAADPG